MGPRSVWKDKIILAVITLVQVNTQRYNKSINVCLCNFLLIGQLVLSEGANYFTSRKGVFAFQKICVKKCALYLIISELHDAVRAFSNLMLQTILIQL